MAAVTAEQIHAALASQLKMDEETLPASWDDLCARGATYANGEVQGVLMSRGFRLDEEVMLWDRYDEFAADLGVWKAMMLGGGYGSFDAKALAALDRHEELHKVYVSVGGTYVKPALGQPGMVASGGPLDDDANATFNFKAGSQNAPNYGIEW